MKLAKREKYTVAVAACLIGGFFLFQSLIAPFFDKRAWLQRGIQVKEEEQAEILKLSAEYKNLQKGSQNMERLLTRRDKAFTLFTFLEKAAGDCGIKERINYMKPSSSKGTGSYKEAMVEMKLEGITLNQLTDYLYRVESPENIVSIRRISVKESAKQSGYLEAVLQAVTYEQG